MSAWDCADDTLVGDLTIDEFPMNTAAWRVENLYELWLPATQRGQNVIRPGVPGSWPVRRYVAETRRSLQMFVSGEVDADGDPYPNAFEGMHANLTALAENVVAPTNTGDGTRAAVLTAPNEQVWVADVHVTGMEVSEMRRNARYCYAVIELTIPAGGFALAGS